MEKLNETIKNLNAIAAIDENYLKNISSYHNYVIVIHKGAIRFHGTIAQYNRYYSMLLPIGTSAETQTIFFDYKADYLQALQTREIITRFKKKQFMEDVYQRLVNFLKEEWLYNFLLIVDFEGECKIFEDVKEAADYIIEIVERWCSNPKYVSKESPFELIDLSIREHNFGDMLELFIEKIERNDEAIHFIPLLPN